MPGPESYNFPVLQGKATDANIETPRSAEIGETSRYDVNYYIPTGGLSAEEIQQTRATNQGFGMELATASANLIPNIALSMVETTAQLADIEDWSNMIQGNAANYGNVITEWASRNKNQFGEIYQKTPGENNLFDSAWWVSNGAGLVESLAAYGLTGYGVGTLFGKAATATAKGLNAFGKAKMGIELSAQLGTSGVLAFTEGAMTGGQVYKDVYADSFNSKLEELLQKGAEQYGEDNLTEAYQKYATTYADQFAKQVAGEAATKTVRINTAINTFLNLPETGALFRSMRTNRYLDDVLKLERGELAKDAVERIKSFDINKHLTRQAITNKVKETGGEMLEEMVNVYAEQQGKNVGREATGQDIMTLGDMLADDDIWAAGFWGAVGGSMNGFVMGKMPKWVTQEDGTKKRTTVGAYNKEQIASKYQEQLTDLTDRLTEFVDARDAMVKASKSGDERAYKEAADKVFSYNSFNSIVKGTEEQLLNDFQNILGLTEEQAAQQGFASDYKERAAEKIQSIRENTKEWNKIQDRYASQDLDQAGFPETIFQQHVNVQNNRKIIQENTLELAKLESEIAQANNLRGTDVTRTSFNDIISSIKAVENSFELATIDLENILNLDKFNSRTQKRIIANLSNMYGNIANARTQIEEHLNELKEKRADLINSLEIQKSNYYSFIDPDNEMSDAEKETRYANTIAQNTADIDALADGKQVLESNKKIFASQEDELRVLKSKEGLERFKQLKKEKMAEREAIDAKAAAKAEVEAAAKAEAAKVEAIKTKKKEAPETVTVEEEEFVEAVTPVESFEEGSYTGEGSTPKELEKQYEDISKVANNSDVEGEIIDSSGKVISVGDRLIEGSNKLAYASTVEYVEEDGKIKHVSLKLNPETNPDLLTDKYAPGTKLKIRRLTAGEFKPFVTAKDLNFIDELGRKILVANKGETVTFEMLSHPYMQPIGIFNEAVEYQAMLHAANYITSDRIVPANVAADLQALINIRAAVTDKFQDITINSKSNGKLNQLPNFHRLSELIDQPVEFAIATSTIQLNSSKTTPVENLANKKGFKVGQVYAITVMPDGRKLAIPVKTTKVKESPEVLSELMAALDTFLKGGNRGDLQNVFGKYLHSVFSSDKLTKSDNAFDEDPNGKDRIYIDFTSSNVDGIIFGRAGFSKKFISGNSPVDSIEALKKELGSLIQESYVNINFEALKDPDFVKYFVKSNVRFYPLPNGKVTVFDNPVIGFDTSTLLNATAPAAKVAPAPAHITELERLNNEVIRLVNIRNNDRIVRQSINDSNNKKITLEELDAVMKKWDDENGLTEAIQAYDAEKRKQAPTPQVRTIEEIKNDIAVLRAREQAEYAAMSDPNDTVEKDRIYEEYDKLITPLIEKAEAEIEKRLKEEIISLEKDLKAIKFKDGNTLEKLFPNWSVEATTFIREVFKNAVTEEDYNKAVRYESLVNNFDIVVKNELNKLTPQPTPVAETPTVEIQPTETINLTSASGIEFEIGLDADDDYSITTAEDLSVKEGVSELFESNPKLANAVYKVLGFDNLVTPNDKIVFGHPGIGKTYLRESGRTDVIDFDSDYKTKINEKFNLPKGFKARNDFQKSNKEEYQKAVRELWIEAKQEAKSKGKQLFASDMILLREFANDFDKVITMSKDTFVNRAKQRNDYTEGETENWKNSLDTEISKINKSKVINTNEYLSDLFITPQQKQQAQQQYSQYLDTIFPDSKVKDIVYHGTDAEFDKFDKELSGNKTGWAKDNKGIHFANNKIAAETYTKSKEDGYGYLALWIYLKKDAKSGKSLTKKEFNNILSDNTKLANTLEGAHYFSAIDINTITFEQYDKWAKLFEKDEQLNDYSRDNLDEILKSVTEKYKNKKANVKSVVLNIKNPLIYDSKGKRYVHQIKDIYSKLKNENDGIIVKNTLDRLNDDIGFEDDIQVVFEPEQIHILGSKQDIEGFKKFAKSGKQIEKYVSLQDKVNNLIQEGKATKFCK